MRICRKRYSSVSIIDMMQFALNWIPETNAFFWLTSFLIEYSYWYIVFQHLQITCMYFLLLRKDRFIFYLFIFFIFILLKNKLQSCSMYLEKLKCIIYIYVLCCVISRPLIIIIIVITSFQIYSVPRGITCLN